MENHQQGPLGHEIPPVIQEHAQQQGQGGDQDNPGQTPDEIVPDQGDVDNPGRAPQEEIPGGGDIDQPGEVPQEMPQHPSSPNQIPPPD
ncbi:hypothetical protein [Tsuneonella sp. HG222]